MYNKFKYQNNDRFGFAAPFLLGALTGGVAVGAFNGGYGRPNYGYGYNYPAYNNNYYGYGYGYPIIF